MSKDNWTGSGYDAKVGGGGVYFRLKEKGDTAKLRLVSEPFRYVDIFKDPKDGDKLQNAVAWVAILKEFNGETEGRVVCFQSRPMVYGHVKDLAENADWGDPKLYDIKVTRTEEAGKYYTVQALPKPIGPITKEEAQMVSAANLDLAKLCLKEIPGTEKIGSPPATVQEAEDEFAD